MTWPPGSETMRPNVPAVGRGLVTPGSLRLSAKSWGLRAEGSFRNNPCDNPERHSKIKPVPKIFNGV